VGLAALSALLVLRLALLAAPRPLTPTLLARHLLCCCRRHCHGWRRLM
jgi:hypothetical protein